MYAGTIIHNLSFRKIMYSPVPDVWYSTFNYDSAPDECSSTYRYIPVAVPVP